jgi:hypothetical protein
MIRSHSVCPDGIERFSDNLMSITSCTNHSGIHNNDACFLVIQKRLLFLQKLSNLFHNQIQTSIGKKSTWILSPLKQTRRSEESQRLQDVLNQVFDLYS